MQWSSIYLIRPYAVILSLFLLLTSCNTELHPFSHLNVFNQQLSAQQILENEVTQDADAIIIELSGTDTSLSEVTSDLILPTEGANGTTISWSSSSPDYVSNSGQIGLRDQNLTVWLTATISKDGYSTTRAFEVVVIQA